MPANTRPLTQSLADQQESRLAIYFYCVNRCLKAKGLKQCPNPKCELRPLSIIPVLGFDKPTATQTRKVLAVRSKRTGKGKI